MCMRLLEADAAEVALSALVASGWVGGDPAGSSPDWAG